MTGPLLYPGADHTTQWVGKGSVTMPMDHVKWVVHTTETASWPSYDYGGTKMGSAPTLTYNPWTHQFRQHFEMNQSARALRNDGDHYTNRVDVVQTEIVCYCDHSLAAKYGHACTDIDAQATDDLGAFGEWLHVEWGMANTFYPLAVPWAKYPAGCRRMTWDRYVTWSGVLGHMAVPGNTHLDPGDLPMDKVRTRMLKGDQKPPPPPKQDHLWPELDALRMSYWQTFRAAQAEIVKRPAWKWLIPKRDEAKANWNEIADLQDPNRKA